MLGETGTSYSHGARASGRAFWGAPFYIAVGLLAFVLIVAMTSNVRPASAAGNPACSATYPTKYCAARATWYGSGEHLYITDTRKDGYSAVVLYEVHN